MFGVEDVVEEGEGGAEALGQILVGEVGEVGEAAQTPLVENFQCPIFQCQMGKLLGEVDGEGVEHLLWNTTERFRQVGATAPARGGTAKNEAVGGGGREGEKVGEVRGGAMGEMGGEAKPADAGVESGKWKV